MLRDGPPNGLVDHVDWTLHGGRVLPVTTTAADLVHAWKMDARWVSKFSAVEMETRSIINAEKKVSKLRIEPPPRVVKEMRASRGLFVMLNEEGAAIERRRKSGGPRQSAPHLEARAAPYGPDRQNTRHFANYWMAAGRESAAAMDSEPLARLCSAAATLEGCFNGPTPPLVSDPITWTAIYEASYAATEVMALVINENQTPGYGPHLTKVRDEKAATFCAGGAAFESWNGRLQPYQALGIPLNAPLDCVSGNSMSGVRRDADQLHPRQGREEGCRGARRP